MTRASELLIRLARLIWSFKVFIMEESECEADKKVCCFFIFLYVCRINTRLTQSEMKHDRLVCTSTHMAVDKKTLMPPEPIFLLHNHHPPSLMTATLCQMFKTYMSREFRS